MNILSCGRDPSFSFPRLEQMHNDHTVSRLLMEILGGGRVLWGPVPGMAGLSSLESSFREAAIWFSVHMRINPHQMRWLRGRHLACS
jgi:hypothetical protein